MIIFIINLYLIISVLILWLYETSTFMISYKMRLVAFIPVIRLIVLFKLLRNR
nr:MAG TPA: hypothetical protein [Caudoviricetes sp.]